MGTLSAVASTSNMTADQVKAWQTTLKNAGYNPGAVDGIWGPNTQAAYNAYNSTSSTYVPGVQTEAVKNTDILDNVAGYKYSSNTGLPDMPNVDIGGAYDSAAETYKQYIDAAKASNQANQQAQQANIGQQYNAARGQAYVNSRLGAIGNNEALAAQGLAGNLYGGPQSGVSESARVAQNVGMRNSINSATLQESSARDQLALEIMQSGLALDMEYAQYMAQAIIEKANAQQTAEQQRFDNSWALYQYAQQLQTPATSSGGYYTGSTPASDVYSGSSSGSSSSGSSGSLKASTGETSPSTPIVQPSKNYTMAIAEMYQNYGAENTKAAVTRDYANGNISSSEYQKAQALLKTLGSGKVVSLPV